MPGGAQNWGLNMADRKDLNESELDDLFAAAQGAAPAPSKALLMRIAGDADVIASERAAPPVRRASLWSRAVAAIGGWPSVAGLAAAGIGGLAIGITSPEALDTATGGYLTASAYDAADFLPGYADLLGDG